MKTTERVLTPASARSLLANAHPYGAVPLGPGDRERGEEKWAAYLPRLSNRARRVLRELPPGEFEVVKGALLATITGKDGYSAAHPGSPILDRVFSSCRELQRVAVKLDPLATITSR